MYSVITKKYSFLFSRPSLFRQSNDIVEFYINPYYHPMRKQILFKLIKFLKIINSFKIKLNDVKKTVFYSIRGRRADKSCNSK